MGYLAILVLAVLLRYYYTRPGKNLIKVVLMLAAGMIVLASLLPYTAFPKSSHSHHEGINLYLEILPSSSTTEQSVYVYALKERKRLKGAEVTFEIWNKHDAVVKDLQDYCLANNRDFDLLKQALIDQGFIDQILAKETEEHLYVGQFQLEPGLWNMGVRVKDEQNEVDEYHDFTLKVEW